MGKDNLEITDFSWYENPYAVENGNVITFKAAEDIRDLYDNGWGKYC